VSRLTAVAASLRAERCEGQPAAAPRQPQHQVSAGIAVPRRSGDSAKAGASWSPEEDQQLRALSIAATTASMVPAVRHIHGPGSHGLHPATIAHASAS